MLALGCLGGMVPHGMTLWHVVFARCDGAKQIFESLDDDDDDVAGLTSRRLAARLAGDDLGRTPLCFAVQLGKPKVVSFLANGQDVGQADIFGNTPLHYAAHAGSVPLCKPLLAGDDTASLLRCNVAGQTPLQLAALSSSPKRVACCALLLEAGGDAQLLTRDAFGATPIFDLLMIHKHGTLVRFARSI